MEKLLVTATLEEMQEIFSAALQNAVYMGVKQALTETGNGGERKRVTAREVGKMYNIGMMAVRLWEKKGLERVEGRGSSALYYLDDVEAVAGKRYKRAGSTKKKEKSNLNPDGTPREMKKRGWPKGKLRTNQKVGRKKKVVTQ
ncbi:MAG: hypothetical protein M3Q97_08915 [Bacteroidota bacterium]|nr:hypothetical protein [Bacteroidota bacterium]